MFLPNAEVLCQGSHCSQWGHEFSYRVWLAGFTLNLVCRSFLTVFSLSQCTAVESVYLGEKGRVWIFRGNYLLISPPWIFVSLDEILKKFLIRECLFQTRKIQELSWSPPSIYNRCGYFTIFVHFSILFLHQDASTNNISCSKSFKKIQN